MVSGEGEVARTITKGTYKLVSAGRHEIELLQVSGVLDDMAVDGSHRQWLGTFKVDIGRSFSPGGWCSSRTHLPREVRDSLT